MAGCPRGGYVQNLGFHFLAPLFSDFPGEAPELAAIRAWIPGFRLDVWRRLLKRGAVPDGDLATQISRCFPDYLLNATHPLEGVTDLLKTLTPRFRLGMVTNRPDDLQVAKLRAAGLTERFQFVATSGALGFGKPDPRIFIQALKELDLTAQEAIMIGDNPVNDVQGALDAGLKPIWLRTRDQDETRIPKTVPRVNSVEQLLDVINHLAG